MLSYQLTSKLLKRQAINKLFVCASNSSKELSHYLTVIVVTKSTNPKNNSMNLHFDPKGQAIF